MELARAAALAHDEVAQEALARAAVEGCKALRRQNASTSRRAWLAGSEASRQSSMWSICSQSPARESRTPACHPARVPNEYSSLLR